MKKSTEHKGILCDSEPDAFSEIHSFTTPNPQGSETNFTVWNDTHEQEDTLRALHTAHEKSPGDFMLWNGDQSNDVHFEKDMARNAERFLAIKSLWASPPKP